MKKGDFDFWSFLAPFLIVLFFVLGLKLLPFLIVGYVIYKVYSRLNKVDLEEIFNKINKKTIELSPNHKGIFTNFNPNKMFEFNFKHLLMVLIIAICSFVVIDGFVSVPASHVAVIFDRGRGVLDKQLSEGFHIKIPFWQEAKIFTTKKQVFTMAGDYRGIQDEDAVRGRSKDGQDVVVDVSITYQVLPKNASHMRKNFLTEDGYRDTIIRPAARSVVYESVSRFNALELVADKRTDFANLIKKDLERIYGDNQIILHEIFVRNVTFSKQFAHAIEEKQIAEQKIKTAENKKKEAEQLKEKKIIEAEAEAEAIRLKGEALRESPEVIQLEFVNKMSPNINWGILPDGAMPLLDVNKMSGQQ
jgi:regulator of protease activity HflC (stomatin/prohibitin superfamily)